jgi:hypothetical protein
MLSVERDVYQETGTCVEEEVESFWGKGTARDAKNAKRERRGQLTTEARRTPSGLRQRLLTPALLDRGGEGEACGLCAFLRRNMSLAVAAARESAAIWKGQKNAAVCRRAATSQLVVNKSSRHGNTGSRKPNKTPRLADNVSRLLDRTSRTGDEIPGLAHRVSPLLDRIYRHRDATSRFSDGVSPLADGFPRCGDGVPWLPSSITGAP